MKYREIPKAHFKISEIGIGAWQLGGTNWGNIDYAEAGRALHYALDKGINFIDTAHLYGRGKSEEFIGNTLHERNDEYRVCTKALLHNKDWWPNYREEDILIKSAEDSLKRLKRETLDVYLIHDPKWDDSFNPAYIEAFRKLKKEGKILGYGISANSDITAEQMRKIITENAVDVLEIEYNIFNRLWPKRIPGFFKLTEEKGIGLIIRTPLSMGFLSGKYNENTVFPENDRRKNLNTESRKGELKKLTDGADKLKQIVKEPIKNLSQLALKYILHEKAVSTIIPGLKRMGNVESNCYVSDLPDLSQETKEKIEVMIDPEYAVWG